jgi:hypothetical protein
MDPTQKMLKEMSNMTRNLDVLVKEIREMNKLNSLNQKTTFKVMEESVKKSEKSAEKSEKSLGEAKSEIKKTRVEGEKSETKNRNKPVKESPSKTSNRNQKDGNDIIKRAASDSIKNANQTLLKTRSVEGALKSGAIAGLTSGISSLSRAGNKKSGSLLKKNRPELKEKERIQTEPILPEKKESKLEKMDQRESKRSKGQKSEVKSEPRPKRDDNIGLFEKLLGKISPKKEEKKEVQITQTKQESGRNDGEAGFFQKMMEKLTPKRKTESTSSDTPVTSANKTSGKSMDSSNQKETRKKTSSSVESSISSPNLLEKSKPSIKSDSKEKNKTTSGSVSSTKSILSKENPRPTSSSQMITENQTLKSPQINQETKESSDENSSNPEPTKFPSSNQSQVSTPIEKASSSSPPSISEKKSTGGKSDPVLTSKDINEIKSLLSAINISLKSPLTIRDNKPLRPRSNMLE